jgi:hypothetical protein
VKKGEHNGRRTERGFRDYAEIIDAEGNRITVRESSLATEHRVRIYCKDRNGAEAQVGHPWRPWAPGETGQHLCVSEPHLNVRDARRLVEALQRFIAHATGERQRKARRSRT